MRQYVIVEKNIDTPDYDKFNEQDSNNLQLGVEIFTELASDTRHSILLRLYTGKSKQTTLTNDLDLTPQESHRQVSRLIFSGMLQKDSDGFLSLTSFGQIVIQNMSSFAFLEKYKNYFMNHRTDKIDSKFLQRIGDLVNCKLIDGTFRIAEKWEGMCFGTCETMNVISTGCPSKAIEWDIQTIKRGAKVKIINGKNTIMTNADFDAINSSELQKFSKKGQYQRRMINHVPIFIVCNEKEATIQFQNLYGMIDPHFAFYSNDKKFLEWCSDYFNHFWNQSYEFNFSLIEHKINRN